MYTLQQAITHIDTFKPDLTDFNEILINKSQSDIITDIKATSDNCVKALKAEIALTYLSTHNQRGVSTTTEEELLTTLENNFDFYNPTKQTISYYIRNRYSVHSGLELTFHLLAHLTDVKQYLPKYLWNKVRTKQIASIKNIKDDLMSFSIFKSYVEKLPKGLSSADALRYIEESCKFNLSQEYLELILDNCPRPSIKLQKAYSIPNIYYTRAGAPVKISKYMSLQKYTISKLATEYQLPVSASVFDERVSDYKPFITNLKGRTPTTDIEQLSYLVNALWVLQFVASKEDYPVYRYCAEALAKHLSLPVYKEPIQDYLNTLSEFNIIKENLWTYLNTQPQLHI